MTHLRLWSEPTYAGPINKIKGQGERAMTIDDRYRDKNGEIGKKYGNTLVGTLRKIYGKTFAAGQADTATLNDVLQSLNDTSLHQLMHDQKNGHLSKRIG